MSRAALANRKVTTVVVTFLLFYWPVPGALHDEAYKAGRSILRRSRGPASTTSSTRDLFRTPVPEITEEAFFGGQLYDATFGA